MFATKVIITFYVINFQQDVCLSIFGDLAFSTELQQLLT